MGFLKCTCTLRVHFVYTSRAFESDDSIEDGVSAYTSCTLRVRFTKKQIAISKKAFTKHAKNKYKKQKRFFVCGVVERVVAG